MTRDLLNDALVALRHADRDGRPRVEIAPTSKLIGEVLRLFREHGYLTDFAGMKYDPAIGIHGMDVAVEVGRAGYRVRDRKVRPRPLPRHLRATGDETRAFLRAKFGVTIVE